MLARASSSIPDAGDLSFSDPVSPLLAPRTLDGLFVVDGKDHQASVTVDQLRSHTSGVADYFADPTKNGKPVSNLIVDDPGHSWTPSELLEFSRARQTTVGVPGQKYHYSDTGYILLGLLVEKLYGAPFETILDRELLSPLGMDRSWMPFRSKPRMGTAGASPPPKRTSSSSRRPSGRGNSSPSLPRRGCRPSTTSSSRG